MVVAVVMPVVFVLRLLKSAIKTLKLVVCKQTFQFWGSTKRTLCGIVLFKLNTVLVMFLQVPSIDSTCFLHT
jgi:hypothetical protein